MRADDPAHREVVDRIRHQRVTVALPADRDRSAEGGEPGRMIVSEAEFLFEADRAPFVAGAGADIEPVAKALGQLDGAYPVRDVVGQSSPATLDPKVESSGPTGHDEPLRLRVRPAEPKALGTAAA